MSEAKYKIMSSISSLVPLFMALPGSAASIPVQSIAQGPIQLRISSEKKDQENSLKLNLSYLNTGLLFSKKPLSIWIKLNGQTETFPLEAPVSNPQNITGPWAIELDSQPEKGVQCRQFGVADNSKACEQVISRMRHLFQNVLETDSHPSRLDIEIAVFDGDGDWDSGKTSGNYRFRLKSPI